MLSPREDDDDDSHLCIKCNSTIIGIDNYVEHRKLRCGKKPEPKPDLSSIDTLDPVYSLGADLFFQSLELQSSVKKLALPSLPIPITKPSLERKPTPSTTRDLPRMSPLETNLRGEDWIGGHTLKIGSHEDNQTKFINAVASISGTAKKEISRSTYNMEVYNDYKGDDTDESEVSDEEDEDEPIVSGGKWKPPPPPNYTGGKWRPASPENDEWDLREEQEHTGGKWKPFEREDDYDAPPPHHTKGKWLPGANEKTQIMHPTLHTKGSVQYWCGPCNRRLGSKVIYEKHLKSKLHIKKVLPERELEFSGHLQPLPTIDDKRKSKPSRFINESIYVNTGKKEMKKKVTKSIVKIEKKKRKRNTYFVSCSGCKSRVRRHLMGKHLISHYHFRKATETDSLAYKQLILDNMDAIVHQSPFQCSPCKFYTNWLSNFMQHWFTEDHEKTIASFDGRIWCSFCKYECESSQEMLQHMSSPSHSEVVAVINRSMPIIIRKKAILRCETCLEVFKYNAELRMHAKKTGHVLPHSATDDYQELHKCRLCKARLKNSVALAAHLKCKHKQRVFFCLVCELTFKSTEEAKRHRFTSDHRIRTKEKAREKGLPVKDLSRKCPYCPDAEMFDNTVKLKEHIKEVHPDMRKRCSRCGMCFTFSQEVTQHIKSNKCEVQKTDHASSSILWNCSQCLFTTDSQAECYYHEVLHTTPLTETRISGLSIKSVKKYTCPLCPKVFTKPSLRLHLRQHTFERPYVCTICQANFTIKSSLDNHMKSMHTLYMSSVKLKKLEPIVEAVEMKEEIWKCGGCLKGFTNRTALSRHKCPNLKSIRCPHEDCPFVATNSAQLARHRRVHGERIKHHVCNLCPYKTDQSSHLKTHKLYHQKKRPYKCPHCSYTTASLENLRKHVIRSGRHPGLFLYLCKLCDYKTNMATDLRIHLVTTHGDTYDSITAMESVKMNLIVQPPSQRLDY